MMQIPTLSLITGTMNRPASFRRLVDSIARHTSAAWELVVSDASDTPVDEPGLPDGVRILPERPRLGCVRGYNRAFREARGEWALWLNDDCEVTPEYDTQAIRFMEAHPQIGLGALHYMEGPKPFHVNSAWGVPYANFGIIRRLLGEQIGWFDDSLTMYGCDNSLTFRVLLVGHGVSDIPAARIIHHSEKDIHRAENQSTRMKDNLTLQQRYMPLREQWTAAYRRNRVDTGTIPWSHGVEPTLTGARSR